MTRLLLPLTCCLGALLLASPLRAEAAPKTLTRFDGADDLRWQTVNDSVMGGRSRGGYSLTSDETLVFRGETSLKNNGGFSSIRTRPQALELAGYEGIALRVRGDGRAYKVSLRTSGTSSWIAYWAELPTVAGEWVDVRIPFEEWVPTTFGRKLPGPALKVELINSVGFMLYDKQAGPFSLEVAMIASYRASEEEGEDPLATASDDAGAPTLAEAAQRAGSFKTLLAAAKAAGLVDSLVGPGPLTVFAPTDAAFGALGEGQVAALLEAKNRGRLQTILRHHVVSGKAPLASLLRTSSVQTLAGQSLEVSWTGGALKVGGAKVLSSDIMCSNGVIHVVDQVLTPELHSLAEVAQKVGVFKTLLAAAEAAGLSEALAGSGPLTVFAPSDQAFAALPEGKVASLLKPQNRAALVRLLKHHILEGAVYSGPALKAGSAKTLAGTVVKIGYSKGSLRVDGTPLTKLDVPAANGVIHVVGGVLSPPALESAKVPARSKTSTARAARLIERAVERGVPLFNAGREESCRAIYELTVRALLDAEAGLFPQEIEALLRKALVTGGNSENAAEGAWALRRALDAAYRFLVKA